MLREEEWRVWPKDDRYEVSSLGRVRSYCRAGKQIPGRRREEAKYLKLSTNCFGYKTVWVGVRNTYYMVHRMMLESFVGIPEEKMQGQHINDIRHDNRIENLKWGTHAQNMRDREQNRHTARGERQGHSRFSEEDVVEIRYHWAMGGTRKAIALLFDTKPSTIKDIVTNRSWKHVNVF